MSIREKIKALCLYHENVGPGTNRERYLALLQSEDPKDHTAQYKVFFADPKTSGCALTVRGLWRQAGLVHPLLGHYKIGHAVLDVLTIAKESGAYVDGTALAKGAYDPAIGDMVYVAAPEHVFTLIEVTKRGPADYGIVSIDGGQTVNNQQIITKRFRNWVLSGRLLQDRPMYGGTVKQILGIVDVSKLPFPKDELTPSTPVDEPPCTCDTPCPRHGSH